tara:strand:- start:1221 stop:3341 length:2121 start_codon:yes stop_codon:yes gene_type:complete
MANIKKNFNFRNGVQVDDDNLLVTATGLVGIGTTVPTEALDVRGDVTIAGFATITKGNIGFLTVTTFEPTQIIGAGVSVKSGIITAEGAGIVTFFGDARFLQGMPTSQWEDIDVGLGYTSIFNTGGNVGIATNDPRFTLQVGGKVDAGQEGVGISSVGNVRVSGIVTAASFVGDLTGNIVSASTFSGDIDLNADIDVDGHTNLDNVSIAGVTTTAGNVDINADLDVDGHTNLDNVSISGVTTFATETVFGGNIDINADIDVDGHTNLDNLSVAGVTTFAGLVDANGGASIDNIQIGVTGDNEIDTASGGLLIDSANNQTTIDDNLEVSGIATFSQSANVAGLTTTRTFQVIETSTFLGDLNAQYVGAASTVSALKLGVGTTDAPTVDIQVRNTNDSEIQVTSETGTARISFGRETGNLNTNNAELRYGGQPGQSYSQPQSLDIVNHGIDNFNYYLSQNNSSNVIGDFHWLKGVNNPLMTLTSDGNLGIGVTTPTVPLQVVGNSNVSGNAVFGGDINCTGTIFSGLTGNVTGDLNGDLFGNVTASSGTSTVDQIIVTGIGTFENFVSNNSIYIGGNYSSASMKFQINTVDDQVFKVSASGRVAIGTDNFSGNKFIVSGDTTSTGGGVALTHSLVVGKTTRECAVDFAAAGKNLTGAGANKMFMLPPKLTDAEQTAITNAGVVSGAVIYNTTDNKLRVYNGTAWRDLH